ncbi:hypothetical protein E2562_026078 [Oryza meyeriana var. granulata]|uniref:Uncharacterized protein n=1 Tax=Oryza meyeriana var. granulata TaxID=110450 RepID=A0A6G1EZ00_9ORYZ|nr:hypothetical protein E2562_026078 [Oryza meyeriana var. granulata]
MLLRMMTATVTPVHEVFSLTVTVFFIAGNPDASRPSMDAEARHSTGSHCTKPVAGLGGYPHRRQTPLRQWLWRTGERRQGDGTGQVDYRTSPYRPTPTAPSTSIDAVDTLVDHGDSSMEESSSLAVAWTDGWAA